MKILLWIVIAIVAIIAILGFMAPKNYEVSRSIEIDKPIDVVYPYLTSIENQDNWSPWFEKDPNMKKSSTGTDGTLGYVSTWDSEVEGVGSGEQEITKMVHNETIVSELRFLKPYESTSTGYINTEAAGNGTKVTWGFYGDNKFPFSIMMLFMDMEEAVGPDFEKGLAKLKGILESAPSPEPVIEAEEVEEDATPA